MKAAVVDRRGGVPEYRDVPDPRPAEGQAVLRVEAVAVENVDRAIVAGTHYTAAPFQAALPAVPCFDGVGRTVDGTLVGFGGLEPPQGALAEYVVVPEGHWAPIPEGIAPETAAALATAITGMSMKTAANLQSGETVLVQGATGVAGRLAVQTARLLGAGRVVATGRDAAALASLAELGAHAVIDTNMSDEDLVRAYRDAAGDGYDVVVDFLWGRPTRVLCQALTPESFAIGRPVRLVQVGEAAGEAFELPARALRTSGLEIYGAARNLMDGMADAYAQVVEWVRGGQLMIDVTTMPLRDIATAWQRTDLRGSRLVIVPDHSA